MAQRLDLRNRSLQAAGLRKASHTPDLGLLGSLFDPGMLYSGFQQNGNAINAPKRADALGMLRSGGQAGLNAFDSYFDQSGQVLDASGLLRALNAGNVLSMQPKTVGHFENNYGGGGGGGSYSNSRGALGALYGGPVGAIAGAFGNDYDRNEVIGKAYGQSTADPELLKWLNDLSLRRSNGGDVAFDPSQIRYGGYQIAPNINLQNSSRKQLEDWSQKTYGVDLLTLAASPTALLEARQQAMANPNSMFNPQNPGMLRTTGIKGLDAETSAARMGDYTQTVGRSMNEAGNQRSARMGGQLNELLRSNPEAMRTGFGRNIGMSANYGQAANAASMGATPQPYDYSLQYQAALMPEMINRAIQAALAGL